MTDASVPIGTKVRYHGSLSYMHGEYTITGYSDLDRRTELTAKDKAESYPDGIAYDLWPKDIPMKFGNRDQAIYYVRRQSFTVIEEEPGESVGVH